MTDHDPETYNTALSLDRLETLLADCDDKERAVWGQLGGDGPVDIGEAVRRIDAARLSVIADLLAIIARQGESAREQRRADHADILRAFGALAASAAEPEPEPQPLPWARPNAVSPDVWRCDVTSVKHPGHTWYDGYGKAWHCRGEHIQAVRPRPIRDNPQA